MTDALPVFIPLHLKDRDVLPHCLRGLRHLRPRPSRVTVVSAELPAALAREIARLGAGWLHEEQVRADAGLPRWPTLRLGGDDRSGWMLQQAIKWEATRYHDAPRHLVIDADTVLVRPTEVVSGGRDVLFARPGCHRPYLDCYARLLGEAAPTDRSFITHFMVLRRDVLEALTGAIRARAAGSWMDAVLSAIDPAEGSPFSEYETYGHFATTHFPDAVVVRPNENKGARFYLRSVRLQLALARALGAGSLSFHGYQRDATRRAALARLSGDVRMLLGRRW